MVERCGDARAQVLTVARRRRAAAEVGDVRHEGSASEGMGTGPRTFLWGRPATAQGGALERQASAALRQLVPTDVAQAVPRREWARATE